MTLEPGISLTVILLLLLVQTVVIGVIGLAVYKASKKATRISDEAGRMISSARPKIDEILEHTGNFIRSLDEMGNHLTASAADLRQFSEKVRESTEDVAHVFQETKIRAEHQIHRVDHLVTDVIDKAIATSEYLNHTVYPQIIEGAALVKGIYTSIEYLRKKKRFPTPSSKFDK